MKKTLIPHPNVPNAEFGDANLKRVTTLFNENFNSLDTAVQSAQTSLASVESSKASSDHTHDERYARLEHQHVTDDVTGLVDLLDNKANLYHEHSQYLTEIPRHQHAINEVDGLIEILNDKAPSNHQHAMSDVTGLDALAANAATFEYVDRQDVANLAASKAYTDAAIGSITPVTPSSLTPLKDKDEGAVGTATTYARGDHQHQLNYPQNKPTTNLHRDGNGTGGTSEFGSTNNYADLGHSHPLNVPSSDGEIAAAKQTIALTIDGMGSDTGNGAALGDTPFYAHLDHIHGLNVTATGTPSDVVKSTGTASNGESSYYARQDHVHKMPALAATDISYGNTTVDAKLTNHETRITTLENEPHGGGTVKSVDSVNPDASGNVALNALTTSNYGTTLNSVYQAKSTKLTNLNTALTDDGKVPLSQLTGNITGHENTCYVTIDNNGALGHSGNAAYNLLNNAANSAGEARGANKLITDLDVGDGIEANSDHDLAVKANNGIEVTADGVSVKAKSGGGINVDEDGVSLGGLSTNGFIKSESGSFVVPTEQPLMLPSGSGYLKSDGSAASVTAQVPATDVNFGDGVTNVTSANISSVAVTSVNGAHGSVSVTPFPGFGTSHTTASYGDHTHSQYEEKDNLGDAAYVDIDVAGGVQGYSAKLTSLDGKLNNDGSLPSSAVSDASCTSLGNCLAYFKADRTLGHLSATSNTATVANTNAVTNVFAYSGEGANRTATLKCTAAGSASAPTTQKVIGFKANATNASLIDAAVFQSETQLEGSKFVKTVGTDGTLKEDDFEGLSDDNPADVGTTASEGTSTTASRADHVHALPTMSGRTEDITASDMLKLDISHASSDGYIKISFFAPIFDKYGRYKGLSSNATWEANKILIDWS